MRTRQRKCLHIVLVGLFVGLLTMDVASAARLIGGRRNACCCVSSFGCDKPCGCEGPAPDKGASAEQSDMPELPVPSPSDATPPEAKPADATPAAPAPTPPISEPPALRPIQSIPPSPAPAVIPPVTEPQPPKPADAAPAPLTPAENAPPKTPEPAPKPVTPAVDDPFAPVPPRATPPQPQSSTPAANPPAAELTALPTAIADEPSALDEVPTITLPGLVLPAAPESDDPFAPVKAAPRTAEEPRQAIAPEAKPTALPLDDSLKVAADGRLPVRQWTDNSGSFKVQARLILILNGQVRLLKETGRTTTVPLERLSDADRNYIEAIVNRYGADLSQLDQLAAR